MRPTTNPNTPLLLLPGFCCVSGCDFEIDPDSLIPDRKRCILQVVVGSVCVAGDVGKLNRRRENTPNYTHCDIVLQLTVTGRDWYIICVLVYIDRRVDDRILFNTRCLHKDSQW